MEREEVMETERKRERDRERWRGSRTYKEAERQIEK